MSDAQPFAGKRAVVTGGTHGIGAAIAERLRVGGAEVLVLDLDAGPQDLRVDLADRAATQSAAHEVLRRLERVDVLVNCAGVYRPAALRGLDLADLDMVMAVNFHGPVTLMSLLSGPMAAQGHGRIVNVTSIHARLSEPFALAYDASKAALESATRGAALELADHGVLVNAVAPGFVATRMSVVDGVDELESEPFTSIYVDQKRLPLRRAARPAEVAHVVAFLASDQNSYVTGQSIVVDGGLSSRF